MKRSQAAVEEVLRLLPDLVEAEDLRTLLSSAARPDPAQRWARAGLLGTVEKRIITAESLERVMDEAERAQHARVDDMFGSLRLLVEAFWTEDEAEVARRLIDWGDGQEQQGRYASARRCFEAALNVALPLPDKGPQIVALRRIARVERLLGGLAEALAYYRRSLELARDAGDLANEIVAGTGEGNVLAMQGHFAEAEGCYRAALARAEERGSELEQGQLRNNLAMVLTRLDRTEEAEQWFARAREAWERLDSPVDQATFQYNLGILRKRTGRYEEARAELETAFALPIPSGFRASVAIELAECCLQMGHIAEAEQWARSAEEAAIASRSTYMLGHLYLGLGKLARARGDEDGFLFYEKALEIARQFEYRLLEAETLMDYALLREQLDGSEEAGSYVERAREIFVSLGNAV